MVLLEGHNINMKEIEILYKKLLLLETDDFYLIESEFFMFFYNRTDVRKNYVITAFMTISNWLANSLRSGVWTYYETANPQELTDTVEYLKESGQKEFAQIFECGIHDYQDERYVGNFNYPEEWISESGKIDKWISEHESWIEEWERDLLLENREFICGLYL